MIGPLPRRSRIHPRSTGWRIRRHRFERDLEAEGLRLMAEVTLHESMAALVRAAEHRDPTQVFRRQPLHNGLHPSVRARVAE